LAQGGTGRTGEGLTGVALADGDGAPGNAVMKNGLVQNAGHPFVGITARLKQGVFGRSAAPACVFWRVIPWLFAKDCVIAVVRSTGQVASGQCLQWGGRGQLAGIGQGMCSPLLPDHALCQRGPH
jgi:hypothetical protein